MGMRSRCGCGGGDSSLVWWYGDAEWPDGYTAYLIGVKGVVVAEGDTYEEAPAGVRSAIQFHIETFGL